jgi:hypothetical protein
MKDDYKKSIFSFVEKMNLSQRFIKAELNDNSKIRIKRQQNLDLTFQLPLIHIKKFKSDHQQFSMMKMKRNILFRKQLNSKICF